MDKVVESIRVVKGPMGLRSQERSASPLARLSRAVTAALRTAPVGNGKSPPGAALG